MKLLLIIGLVVFLNSCKYFEEEPEILLSSIDGEEYYETLNGSMNASKAVLLISDGLSDSVSYEMKLDIVDSLELVDSTWRKKYLSATSVILKEVYLTKPDYICDRAFSFFIHYPETLIKFLNNDGFDDIELWMEVLSLALQKAISPEDITLNSVANATLSNCKLCNEQRQKIIVEFIYSLDEYNKQ